MIKIRYLRPQRQPGSGATCLCRFRPCSGTITALILLLAFGATAAIAAEPVKVIVAEARETAFVDHIEALGTLLANESVTLTATITETISAIRFDDGDRVSRNTVLVEMTSDEERALLDEARAV